MIYEILDIGCGSKPKGNVNIDIRNNNFANGQKHFRLSPKQIPNFILADGQFLPLKSNLFNVVFSNHVLEHIPNFVKALKEMIRVSKKFVVIIVPHRFGLQTKYHIHKWFNTKYFKKLFSYWKIKGLISDYNVSILDYKPKPRINHLNKWFIPIPKLPNQIKMRLQL